MGRMVVIHFTTVIIRRATLGNTSITGLEDDAFTCSTFEMHGNFTTSIQTLNLEMNTTEPEHRSGKAPSRSGVLLGETCAKRTCMPNKDG